MDQAEVIKKLDNIESGLKSYVDIVDTRVKGIVSRQENLVQILIQDSELKIANITTSLLRTCNVLAIRVTYSTVRVTIHSSPEIITLLLAMVTIYRIITFAVFVFNVLKIIGTVWQINQMIMAVWPRYRDWFNGLLTQVSEMSGFLGWGVDGIAHLINACSGGINVLGGLMGKDWNLMRLEIMERSNELVVQMSRMLSGLKEDPGRWLNTLFENRTLLTAYDADKWWGPIAETITEAVNKAETAARGVRGVIGELSQIQNDMPEVVRQHIPASIWSGLAKADSAINTYILPHLATIDRNLQYINALLNASLKRGSELADKLANPGDLLLGVDDLPDYVKAYQEGLIDDVTSREFETWTNSERSEIQGDIYEFDRINALMHAPTPEPAFLSMEIPKGSTIRGITAEPHETWFPGGVNDPR